ncbi:hypothetical protein QC281_37875 [Streptomyces sp. DH17]|nr:hypothetical protein [Streptomyces sp. DH17]
MSLFRRKEIWYASYSLPGGKRIKESLGTKDKRQAQELHDKRKAELWRVEKLGDLPDVTFEEACLRWLEEKADKKSLDSDKSRIEFWLEHFDQRSETSESDGWKRRKQNALLMSAPNH